MTSSALDCEKFLFYGFLNSKESKRIKELQQLKNITYTIIFYEAPHRIIDMLDNLLNVFGDRKISISREISKKFEEIYRGNCSDIIKELGDVRGEFVIVVDGNKNDITYDSLSLADHVKMYMNDGLSEKEAIKMVAKDRNIKKNDVYKEVKLFPGK